MGGRIVVGIDRSTASSAALAWAASEARLCGAELVVCSVAEQDPRPDPTARSAVEELTHGWPVTVLEQHGEADVELLAAAEHADLLVVGSRGRGAVAGAVLGSVSHACLTRARCPVAVVRGPLGETRHGRVVVGVDGSEDARAALLLAAREARLRGAALEVLHAVHWDNIGTELITPTPEQLLAWGHKLVAAEIEATAVGGEQIVVHGRPGSQLVRRSEQADLLVLGTHGHNAAASLVLGSVSEHCARYARCPVMVTRADREHPAGEEAPTSSTRAVS